MKKRKCVLCLGHCTQWTTIHRARQVTEKTNQTRATRKIEEKGKHRVRLGSRWVCVRDRQTMDKRQTPEREIIKNKSTATTGWFNAKKYCDRNTSENDYDLVPSLTMVMPRDDEAHNGTMSSSPHHWETIYWTVPESWRATRVNSLEIRQPLLQQRPMNTKAELNWSSMSMAKHWWCHRWIWFGLFHPMTPVRAEKRYLMVDRPWWATRVRKASVDPMPTGRTDSNSLSPEMEISPIDDWTRDSLNYEWEREKCDSERQRPLLTYHTLDGSRAIDFENSLRCRKCRKTSVVADRIAVASSTSERDFDWTYDEVMEEAVRVIEENCCRSTGR